MIDGLPSMSLGDLPRPLVIGNLTLGLPVLAWGLLAVSIPILIHLILRERPRQEIFPAMRFLMATHASATRAQWLRHLLLMLARAMVIVLAMGILGRFGCTQQGGAGRAPMFSSGAPASVVICIDNSASMGYRYQGQTRVQAAIDWARSLLEDHRHFGPGSQFALVSGTPTPGMEVWREDRRATGRLLDTIQPAAHNLSGNHLLGRAYGLLTSARHDRREVYLFNDLTETSWGESPPPEPDSLTRLHIMDVGQEENRNVALSWPHVPPHELPAGAPASIAIRVINGDLPSEPVLQVSIDGTPRGRQSAGPMAPNSQTRVMLNLPPLTPGPHGLTVALEPPDALGCDNTRFSWLMIGALPRVGVLQTESTDVGRMVEAMIAPPQLPSAQQRYIVEPIAIESLLDRQLADMMAVVLADVSGLNGLAWAKMDEYVRQGGTLIIIPGPHLSPNGYRETDILPAEIEGVSACDPPLRPAAADLAHTYLRPFEDLTIDSVNDRHAFRRLTFARLAPQASVIFPFADGSPALLETTVGAGRTLLFAFSPAADWGQFGTQAAPMIVLLHRILETVRPPLDSVASLTAGQPAVRAVGEGTMPLLVHSERGDEQTVRPAGGRYALPADVPQLYAADVKAGRLAIPLHYSVNVAESESRSARVDGDTFKSRFRRDLAGLVKKGDPLEMGAAGGSARVNWGVPLGILLIVLLLVESSFSNRFYRSIRH